MSVERLVDAARARMAQTACPVEAANLAALVRVVGLVASAAGGRTLSDREISAALAGFAVASPTACSTDMLALLCAALASRLACEDCEGAAETLNLTAMELDPNIVFQRKEA